MATHSGLAQNTYISKFGFGIEMTGGHSFPDFDEQSRWSGSFYPTGGVSLFLINRNNKWLQSEIGLGLIGYALSNKGPYDSYYLNFTVPHLNLGFKYFNNPNDDRASFVGATIGSQLLFKGSLSEQYEHYNVLINNNRAITYFIKPNVGYRSTLKLKKNGMKKMINYELDVFFRCNLTKLGTVTFVENNSITITKPNGNIIGFDFRLIFPYGKKRIRTRSNEIKRARIGKSVRFL
ncbi:MAG: hypothetical protein MRY83_21470 [Flavobacteriales bacterium]|nr:hypothetical protein [Flavobacteriales bacterium]